MEWSCVSTKRENGVMVMRCSSCRCRQSGCGAFSRLLFAPCAPDGVSTNYFLTRKSRIYLLSPCVCV